MKMLLILNLAVTCYLLGLILTVQVVHYPGFIYVDKKMFNRFHLFHMRRISLIVMLPMALELIFAAALSYAQPDLLHFILLGLVVLIWISTALLSVPRHNKLSEFKNNRLISELVLTNWPRTTFWTLRMVVLLYLTQKVIL